MTPTNPFICLSIKTLICITRYRVLIRYCGFSLKFCDFSELCQFCCTKGKQRKTRVRNILKSFEKKTQSLMNTLYVPSIKGYGAELTAKDYFAHSSIPLYVYILYPYVYPKITVCFLPIVRLSRCH